MMLTPLAFFGLSFTRSTNIRLQAVWLRASPFIVSIPKLLAKGADAELGVTSILVHRILFINGAQAKIAHKLE